MNSHILVICIGISVYYLSFLDEAQIAPTFLNNVCTNKVPYPQKHIKALLSLYGVFYISESIITARKDKWNSVEGSMCILKILLGLLLGFTADIGPLQ